MIVKAAGKISYSEFSSTFLLKNPQTRLIMAQTGKLAWLHGIIFRKPLCMAAWEFSYTLGQNFYNRT